MTIYTKLSTRSEAGANILVLDFSRVGLVDAAGLGTLLKLREWSLSKNIEFKLMNLTRCAQDVFEITRLDRVFDIISDDAVLTATAGPTSVAASAMR